MKKVVKPVDESESKNEWGMIEEKDEINFLKLVEEEKKQKEDREL